MSRKSVSGPPVCHGDSELPADGTPIGMPKSSNCQCAQFTPHQWMKTKCRDCGHHKVSHYSAESAVAEPTVLTGTVIEVKSPIIKKFAVDPIDLPTAINIGSPNNSNSGNKGHRITDSRSALTGAGVVSSQLNKFQPPLSSTAPITSSVLLTGTSSATATSPRTPSSGGGLLINTGTESPSLSSSAAPLSSVPERSKSPSYQAPPTPTNRAVPTPKLPSHPAPRRSSAADEQQPVRSVSSAFRPPLAAGGNSIVAVNNNRPTASATLTADELANVIAVANSPQAKHARASSLSAQQKAENNNTPPNIHNRRVSTTGPEEFYALPDELAQTQPIDGPPLPGATRLEHKQLHQRYELEYRARAKLKTEYTALQQQLQSQSDSEEKSRALLLQKLYDMQEELQQVKARADTAALSSTANSANSGESNKLQKQLDEIRNELAEKAAELLEAQCALSDAEDQIEILKQQSPAASTAAVSASAVSAQTAQLESQQAKLTANETEIQQLKTELSTVQKQESDRLNKAAVASTSAELIAVTEQLATIQSTNTAQRLQIEQLNSTITELQSKLTESQSIESNLRTEYNSMRLEYELHRSTELQLRTEMHQSVEELAHSAVNNEKLKRESDRQNKLLESNNKEITQLHSTIDTLKSTIDSLQAELNRITSELQQAQFHIDKLSSESTTVQLEYDNTMQLNKSLSTTNEQLISSNRQLQNQLIELKQSVTLSVEANNIAQSNRIIELESELNKLKFDQSVIQSNSNSTIQSLTIKLSQRQKELTLTEKELFQLQNQLKIKDSELTTLNRSESLIKEELNKFKSLYESNRLERDELELKLESLEINSQFDVSTMKFEAFRAPVPFDTIQKHNQPVSAATVFNNNNPNQNQNQNQSSNRPASSSIASTLSVPSSGQSSAAASPNNSKRPSINNYTASAAATATATAAGGNNLQLPGNRSTSSSPSITPAVSAPSSARSSLSQSQTPVNGSKKPLAIVPISESGSMSPKSPRSPSIAAHTSDLDSPITPRMRSSSPSTTDPNGIDNDVDDHSVSVKGPISKMGKSTHRHSPSTDKSASASPAPITPVLTAAELKLIEAGTNYPVLEVKPILQRWKLKYNLSEAQLEYFSKDIEEILEGFDQDSMRKTLKELESQINTMEYYLLEKIGTGGFGAVYRGIRRKDNIAIAIKIIDLEETQDDIMTISREIVALTNGQKCPQLTSYYGSVVFESKLWIAMELIDGGSVLDRLKACPLDEKYIAVIVREILAGLMFLNASQKIHRDIKSANILLAKEGRVLLGDFGASRQLTETMTKCNTFVGSPYWMAPEVMMQNMYDGKADIWSLGITCLEMANGKPPYAHIHPLQVMNIITRSQPPQLEGEQFSKQFKEFVSLCLIKDPTKRPPLALLSKHPFVKKAKDNKILRELFKK